MWVAGETVVNKADEGPSSRSLHYDGAKLNTLNMKYKTLTGYNMQCTQ